MRPAGGRRTRSVIQPVTVASQPDEYDGNAVDRALDEVATVANALIERRPTLQITSGTVTISRPAITLVAGAGITITIDDDAATNSATITIST